MRGAVESRWPWHTRSAIVGASLVIRLTRSINVPSGASIYPGASGKPVILLLRTCGRLAGGAFGRVHFPGLAGRGPFSISLTSASFWGDFVFALLLLFSEGRFVSSKGSLSFNKRVVPRDEHAYLAGIDI